MSWIDAMKKQVLDSLRQSSPGSDVPADPEVHAGMFDHIFAMVREKGLGDLGKAFEAKGMKDIFASWVGTGSNLPISADQLKKVLNAETLQGFARKLGIPADQASAMLARILPGLVDKMTPAGSIEEPPAEPPAAEPAAAEGSSPASF